MAVRILQGDCREVLATLPDASVHCCVTSPPYWGLRDYGVDGQLGMETDYRDHIAVMVEVFREVRRVLRPDGTLWLNYGDCYASSVNGRSAADTKTVGNDDRTFRDKPFSTVQGVLKPKDLVMMPARVAIALQEDGWWLRSEIIWSKPNPMPESITDRPSSAHEKIYLLARSSRYFYDAEAIRENRTSDEDAVTFRGDCYVGGEPGKRGVVGNKRMKVPAGWDQGPGAHGTIHRAGRTDKQRGHGRRHDGFNDRWDAISKDEQCFNGRNARNVWEIATRPFSEAHFATFPPELAERCIKAGTSEKGCCSACGAPWARIIERGQPSKETTRGKQAWAAATGQRDSAGGLPVVPVITTGWRATCACDASTVPCAVLDPFAGAFTTAMVADRLQRDAIGIELNPAYCAMAERRLHKDAGLFAEVSR